MIRKVLIIEDEPGLQVTLKDRLSAEKYSVTITGEGQHGIELAKSESFDVIILDIMLPDISGFDVCRDLRRFGLFTPVLMLTARGEITDKVIGLKLGADDYLTKPFEMIELLARIEAILRRSGEISAPGGGTFFKFGKIEIYFDRAEVRRNDEILDLSAQEFRLLRFFVENRGSVVSRDELLDRVWGYDKAPSTRTVDVHVAWLRQKIEDNPKHPRYIQTIHKLGYKFTV